MKADVKGNYSKLLEHLYSFANELHCFLCDKLFKSPRTATQCGHVYCNECIQKYLKSGNTKCPQCPVPINKKSLTRNDSYATMVQCVTKIQNLLKSPSNNNCKTSENVEEKNQRDAEVFMSLMGDVMTADDESAATAVVAIVEEEKEEVNDENLTQLIEVKLNGGTINQNLTKNKIDSEITSKSKEPTRKLEPATKTKKVKVTPQPEPAQAQSKHQSQPQQAIGLLLTGLSDDQKYLIHSNLSKMSKLPFSKKLSTNSGATETLVPFTIVRDYSPDTVTHIICACGPKSKCPRTLKYLLGIAGKAWIVSFDWFLESLSAGKILPEEEYVVKGDEAVQIDTEACEKSRKDPGKLFQGLNFYLAGPFNAPGPSKADLTALICLAGGSMVKKPEKDPILISNNFNGPKPGEKPYTWLFDCLSHYKIQQQQ